MRLPKSLLAFALLTAHLPIAAAQTITTPKQALGFNIGDDYHVANYTQLEAYWKKLATESDRMKLVSIGTTSEGRPQYMAIFSSPENLKNLDHYRDISRRLSLAKDLTDAQAHALAKEGKSVVWIDGGLHASETVGSQQIIEWVYQLASRNDEETLRFLHDSIILCVAANPDGQELVANWYMREPVPEKRKAEGPGTSPPRLWNKYAGHDNNRDFFMANLAETTNIDSQLFRTWYPQIMYNHHQTGPAGTVIFVPPFRDPFNYHFDPLIPMGIQSVGTAIHMRFIEEDKPGSTMRSGATYSTWYNGGLRTVTYFHNQIGILTEIIGSPTPWQLPLLPSKQLPTSDLPYPVKPQLWHYRQSIDYEMTANRAILDYASRNREQLLYDIYRMGKNSIERGQRDSWTVSPKRIAAVEAAAVDPERAARPGRAGAPAEGGRETSAPAKLYDSVLHDPAKRDPRVYILPATQPDFPTATKFINTLLKNGVTVLQASSDFTVEGKPYPKNSYIVKADQAYRPHILDMFEPQDHPNDFRYPGGPPIPPYDVTGYTLAMQMGVHYDRFYAAVEGPFKEITENLASPPTGDITGETAKTRGFLISHEYNDAVILTNRLLKAGCDVQWLQQPTEGLAAGAIWIPATPKSREIVTNSVTKLGLHATALATTPTGPTIKLKPIRIGLADQYGGSMPSGWTRFLLEQFEFPFEVVYPQTLDAGHLHDHYDVLILADGAIQRRAGSGDASERPNGQPKPEDIPAEFRPWLGRITPKTTIPQLQQFAQDGGTILTIGSSTALADLLHLPVRDGLTELRQEKEEPLPREKFYIPGSLLRAQIDNTVPLAYGLPTSLDVFFDNSPSFRLAPDAELNHVHAVSWYKGPSVLDSGWAWGQQYLDGTAAVVDIAVGKGRVVLFGPEIAFRGQPHGTFKLLFNGILTSASNPR
ncbi:Zinc carboxypeptidase [Granulicella pectinivorans]|uniref:Zinc carboxypeptidase n=1 Tax=Granulicella pectinivorans TaxID=474950 RepID=A0A1I6M628_9BACT|nr:M14 metallopeptidase family protein [Granulicella pectinivorans]SFS11175.1 Zinc carboxypeptidase [Granulicella pectinivorans]